MHQVRLTSAVSVPVRVLDRGAATLNELSQEVAFFTPALLIARGGFDRCAVSLFNEAHPAALDELAFAVDCPWPFFSGLGQTVFTPGRTIVDLDRRIYGIHRDRRDALISHICQIGMYDPRTQSLGAVFAHFLDIIDPFEHSGLVLPAYGFVPICVFGVATKHGAWRMTRSGLGLPAPQFIATQPPATNLAAVKDYVA